MNDIFINFVLDNSGSMGGKRNVKETVEGFNQIIEEQLAVDGDTFVTLTLFDTVFDVRYAGIDARKMPALGTDDNPYQPSGGTALYDAVRESINETDKWLASNPQFGGKVVTIILTDGQENSSSNKDITSLNTQIAFKRSAGWEFVFIGSGGSAWTEGKQFQAVSNDTQIHYDSAVAGASNAMYAGMSAALTHSRVGGQSLNSVLRQHVHTVADDTETKDSGGKA